MASGESNTAVATPGENTSGWLATLGKAALKKIAYIVLEWVNKSAGGQEPVPGAKKQEVGTSDFLGFLKNGNLLVQLANALQPGAIPSGGEEAAPKPSDKIGQFLNFAKSMGGVKEGDLFKAEDLASGKGFLPVLTTLVNLGGNSQQNFGKEGLSMENLAQVATTTVGKNAVMSFFSRIFKGGSSSGSASGGAVNAGAATGGGDSAQQQN